MVIFISQSEKKAILTVRKILDSFADRIGDDTWQTEITEAGLLAVKAALRRNATKNMAVSCRWIRSRSRSELLWVVGNRNKFNAEGLVPVNWTQKNVSHFEWENQWQYLPLIKALDAVAALFHDCGKTNDYFQNKLRRHGGKNRMDPFRHEWISCKFLEALIAVTHSEETDENWMKAIISGTIHEAELLKKIQENQTIEKQCHLGKLPPLASAIVWLILSHHRIADKKGEAKDGYEQVERGSFESVLSHLSADWGYQNPRKEEFTAGDFAKCFNFSEGLLWERSAIWQKELKKWVSRLRDVSISLQQGGQAEELTQRPAFRLILLYARLCLMRNGKKSKVLYQVNDMAAMHSQKIGNALRTIDTWYPEYGEPGIGPIAVEPYGAVTTLGKTFRSPKEKVDFYTLFDDWSTGTAPENETDKDYVMAVLVRGGVFGASGKE